MSGSCSSLFFSSCSIQMFVQITKYWCSEITKVSQGQCYYQQCMTPNLGNMGTVYNSKSYIQFVKTFQKWDKFQNVGFLAQLRDQVSLN